MKNPKELNIEEIAKIEKCDCTEVCEPCKEKHSHSFAENSADPTHFTGLDIANIIMGETKVIVNKRDELSEVLDELAAVQLKLKKILKSREENFKQ